MFYWVYDLHNSVFCSLVVGVCAVFSVGGMLILRPCVRRFFGSTREHNDVVNYFLSAAGMFYGITLGLIAVGAWQTYDEAESRVAKEAASLEALYRDASALPEPHRAELKKLLLDYVDYVIDQAWPLQRHGVVPDGGSSILNNFQECLTSIEPQTELQKILLSHAFGQFNGFIELRRLRLEAVTSGMPQTLWAVVFAGGAVTMMLTWFFVIEKLKTHILLVTLMAVLIGLLIFMAAAMDYPFRGEFGIGPGDYEMVRDQLMR